MTVTLSLDGRTKEYRVSKRVFKMVQSILDARDRITKSQNFWMRLNCFDDSVKADIGESYKVTTRPID